MNAKKTMISASKPRLLFLATEDWFFCSHFLPMAKTASDLGYDVAVACRVRDHGGIIEELGIELLPFESERRSLNLLHNFGAILKLRRMMKAFRPDVVQLIGLKPILIGGLVAKLLGIQRRIYAVTGMGIFAAHKGLKTRLLYQAIPLFLRTVIDGRAVKYLFENRSDPNTIGLNANDEHRITILGGAGVDPQQFKPALLSVTPPLKIALISRMVWSKGVDVAVEAVRMARVRGLQVELSLHGAPDPDNPLSLSSDTLQTWGNEAGINWRGAIKPSEVATVWANHHCAILPSRGGEGLPRSLLEAASCGRTIITTDVPGCRDLVRDGVEGFIVPVDDATALTVAIEKLAANPELLQTMGDAARERILAGYTTDHLKAQMTKLYLSMRS